MSGSLIAPNYDVRAYREYAQKHYPGLCRPRPEDSHKGTFGTLAVIGGAEGMSGAVLLAASAALYTGCGKAIAAFNQAALPLAADPVRPELILDTLPKVLKRPGIDTWVAGCGLGRDNNAVRLIQALWNSGIRQLVLDADALHILVENPQLFPLSKRADLVLTPHPGEAAHLLNISVNQVQANRSWAARELASRYRSWVVLKGHQTVISSSRGFLHVNPSGNAGLAVAGSGDVLSGMIGSLMAQGIAVEEAVSAAVWLHGAAAEILAGQQIGPIGLQAGEIALAVRWLRNRLAAN